MPALTQGGLGTLQYVVETTIGTTPATPQTVQIPTVKWELIHDKTFIEDKSMTSDNMKLAIADGNVTYKGSIECTHRHGQFDELLGVGMMGTWATNILTLANTEQGITFEEKLEDGTTDRYNVYTGCVVNSFEIGAKLNSTVDLKFDLIGRGYSTSGTALDTTPTAIQNKQPFTTAQGSITVDGSSFPIQDITIKVDNAIDPKFTIGSASAYGNSFAGKTVSGSFTALFTSDTVFTKFKSGALGAIVLTLSDGTNTHTISIPSAKFVKFSKPVSEGALIASVDFSAVKDATLGSMIKITRS